MSTKDREFFIAKTLFKFFNHELGEFGHGMKSQPPFSFNEDRDLLEISIDGCIDCRTLAKVIESTVAGFDPIDEPTPDRFGLDDFASEEKKE